MDIDYSIEVLYLSFKNLTTLPDLTKYINLKVLKCSRNKLTSLNNLPPGLQNLDCSDNEIRRLDNLPPGLKILYCHFHFNEITTLDNLPPELKVLN